MNFRNRPLALKWESRKKKKTGEQFHEKLTDLFSGWKQEENKAKTDMETSVLIFKLKGNQQILETHVFRLNIQIDLGSFYQNEEFRGRRGL